MSAQQRVALTFRAQQQRTVRRRWQPEVRGVLDIDEIQAIGWCGLRAGAAISPRKQLRNPRRRLAPVAHAEQRSRDISNHMVQESVCPDLDDYQITTSRYRDTLHLAHWRCRLAGGGLEGTEIPLPQQVLGGGVHGAFIKVSAVPGELSLQ